MNIIRFTSWLFIHVFLLGVLVVQAAYAQQDDYITVITKRSQKIVDKLGLEKADELPVRNVIMQQYRHLNDIHTAFENEEKQVKTTLSKEAAAAKMAKLTTKRDKQLARLHTKYLKKLRKQLTEEQVERIKNEMTYNVLPITYKGYLDMLPTLTQQQQQQILDYLTEAREKAMDAGSSEDKHWWFGKYKGKINNYLSREGVETKKAREIWEKKLKEERQAKKNRS